MRSRIERQARGRAGWWGLVLVLCLSAQGCVTADRDAAAITRWMGAGTPALVAAWGRPSRQFPGGRDTVVYEYDKRTASLHAMYVTPGPGTGGVLVGGGPRSLSCVVRFTVKEGTIIGVEWTGEGCRS